MSSFVNFHALDQTNEERRKERRRKGKKEEERKRNRSRMRTEGKKETWIKEGQMEGNK